jgi:hypothetical protein
MDHNRDLTISQSIERLSNLIQIELHFPFQSIFIFGIFALIFHVRPSFALSIRRVLDVVVGREDVRLQRSDEDLLSNP